MVAYVHSSGANISMCIYTITHRDTGRVYVGQTRGVVKRRWQMHCAPSNKNKRGIGGAIAKHGKDAFDFCVLDLAEGHAQLDHKERFWIDRLNTLTPNGFNLETGGNSQKIVTEESRQRRRASFSRWLELNPDRSSFGNGARGRKRRPEEIAAIKAGLTGRQVSKETKERIAAKQRGVPKSRDYTLRMARGRMKGLVLQRSDGIFFQSYLEASEAAGVSKPAIRHAANGKTKSAGGFTWKLEVGRAV